MGARAKVVVGGKREGWISWDQIYQSASSSHCPVNTHKDDIMQVMFMVRDDNYLCLIKMNYYWMLTLYQIYFTSGTTGAPKMVGHTHSSYGFCHQASSLYLHIVFNLSSNSNTLIGGKISNSQ